VIAELPTSSADKPGSNRPVARGTVQVAQLTREALAADRELPAGIDQPADQGTLAERTGQVAGPVPEILAEPLDQAVTPARRLDPLVGVHLVAAAV